MPFGAMLALATLALPSSAYGAATPAGASRTFGAGTPSSEIALNITGTPTQGAPLIITVTGSAGAPESLYVAVGPGSYKCPADGLEAGASYVTSGTGVGEGPFSRKYPYAPSDSGAYTVCAYLTTGEGALPGLKAEGSFNVPVPTATVLVTLGGTPATGAPLTVAVAGTTEAARNLYVAVYEGASACAANATGNAGTFLALGTELGAGAFSYLYSYTPLSAGQYMVCAYVSHDGNATPDALAGDPFFLGAPQTPAAGAAAHSGAGQRGHSGALAADEPGRGAREAVAWAAAKAAALRRSVTRLSVRSVARPGGSSRHPGETVLLITTSPFARVTVTLRRSVQSTTHYDAQPAALGAKTATLSIEYPWTCARPGASYSYTVTARTDVGRAITRRGRFHTVSAARCQAFKRVR